MGFLRVIGDVTMMGPAQRHRDGCVEVGTWVGATRERLVNIEVTAAAQPERAGCLTAEPCPAQRRLADGVTLIAFG